MTREDVNKLVAMYIVAIGEKGIPNSHLWMAIDKQMSDLDLHQRVLSVLKQAGLVSESNYFCTLTVKGKEMLAKIEAIYVQK